MRYLLLIILIILIAAGAIFLVSNYDLDFFGDNDEPQLEQPGEIPLPPDNGETPSLDGGTDPSDPTSPPPGQQDGTGETPGAAEQTAYQQQRSQNLLQSSSPNSGNYNTGQTVELDLLARPPADSTGSNLRLEVVGGQILSYQEPSNWDSIATGSGCAQRFTETFLCVDLRKSAGSTIQNGESLGTISVRVVNPGTFALRYVAGNGYIDSDGGFAALTGPIGQFAGTGLLPQTNLLTSTTGSYALAISAIIMGLLAFVYRRKLRILALELTGGAGLAWNAFGDMSGGDQSRLQRVHLQNIKSHSRHNFRSKR